jgi:phage terminase small subunit
MGSGGARPGAGRKPNPKDGDGRNVLAMPERRAAVPPQIPVLDDADKQALLEAPAELPVDAQPVWKRWASHAIAERTLTPATAAGFRQFCEQWAYLEKLAAKINHLGADTKEAAGYLLNYLKLAQRVVSSMARFKLTAFGKPAVSDKPKAAANPWAQVVGK